MADYAISTNLISWVLAQRDIFGWPMKDAEAEVIEAMQPGDRLVPKFAQNPDFGPDSQVEFVKSLCEILDLDYEEEFNGYQDLIDWGAGAVPFVWTVESKPRESTEFPERSPWMVIDISRARLSAPFSTSEFLRLRIVPIEIARQFKAMAAPGRHIQRLPDETVNAIERFGSERPRHREALRSLTLVRNDLGGGPLAALERTGRSPQAGDFFFLVAEDGITGFYEGGPGLELIPRGEEIAVAPAELPELMQEATERATKADGFRPLKAVAAARELADFVAAEEPVRDVAEFGTFYDCYVILPKKVSQALELAERDLPPEPIAGGVELDGDEDGEQIELDNLHGLTVSAAAAHLEDLELPGSVLAEAVTALRAGKHLLLSGPPGTGKSTIAAALCRAVVGEEFDVVTATADWTTFETIGGYMPRDGTGSLEFEPGLVLRALQRGRWLVVDEINRADIDKAFGPLFTLLAGADGDGVEDVVLPYRKDERNIRIVRAERREGALSPFALTPVWRLIGSLNARDKATLYQLSFAFLRRFAVVDVPLPDADQYRRLYEGWSSDLEDQPHRKTADAAMAIAFGRRQLGPAILKDIAEFTRIGMMATDTASRAGAYVDPVEAFLTAVRLYAVPQYEGASRADGDDFLQRLRAIWSDPPPPVWQALERALAGVVLS